MARSREKTSSRLTLKRRAFTSSTVANACLSFAPPPLRNPSAFCERPCAKLLYRSLLIADPISFRRSLPPRRHPQHVASVETGMRRPRLKEPRQCRRNGRRREDRRTRPTRSTRRSHADRTGLERAQALTWTARVRHGSRQRGCGVATCRRRAAI
jgi:hypothetical protein